MSKIADSAVGVTSGVTIGFWGTLHHQSLASGAPVGLLLSIISLMSIGLLLRHSKSLSWSFASSLSVTVFILAQSYGSDALIPANPAGYAWAFGATGISFLLALSPRIRKGPSTPDSIDSEHNVRL